MGVTNFAPDEFRCRCGRPECDAPKDCHRLLRLYLDRMRDMLGVAIVVTSGNRCAEWNKRQGGQPDSEHVNADGCLGADVACANSALRWRMLDAARHAGFTRIGVYPKHLHVGVGDMPRFPPNVVWVGATR